MSRKSIKYVYFLNNFKIYIDLVINRLKLGFLVGNGCAIRLE